VDATRPAPSPASPDVAAPARRWVRRIVFVGLVVVQVGMVVRAYWAPHMEFGYQMFPEASEWQAEIVRVTTDGERVSIAEPWSGYEWNRLVGGRGLINPWLRDHADAGVDNQLEFLDEALHWVAANTPNDTETVRLEADVTVWRNLGDPEHVTMTVERDVP
jgi:hypothetical protein